MHLIELIATLEAVKVARGNILLVDAAIMASGDSEPLVDYTGRKPKVAPVRERIDITGMHEEQIDELKAEHPDAQLFTRCNIVDVAKGACTLDGGHEGEHAWTNPDAELDPTAKEVEKELGDITGMHETQIDEGRTWIGQQRPSDELDGAGDRDAERRAREGDRDRDPADYIG